MCYVSLVYHMQRYNTTVSNPCHNSACTHLCLIVPGGHRCACPDNSNLHNSGSEVTCDAAAERPRPSPRVCKCQNGGICQEGDLGSLTCLCPPDFHGEVCNDSVKKALVPGSGTNTAAIVIPIVVILLILLASGAVYFVLRKRPL
jgi:low density lipoprotein-related protein 2